MTLEEKKARIAELLADHNRQPADDQELERLQREVSLATQPVVNTQDQVVNPVVNQPAAEPSMAEVKAKAAEKGIMYKIGMTKAYLLKKLEELEKAL